MESRDITLMDSQTFNVGAYLQKKGITFIPQKKTWLLARSSFVV